MNPTKLIKLTIYQSTYAYSGTITCYTHKTHDDIPPHSESAATNKTSSSFQISDQKGHWDQAVYTFQDKQDREHDP